MIAAASAFLFSGLAATEALAAGAEKKCKSCHNFSEKHKVGPGLKGIVGMKAGKQDGFKYSDDLASATFTWDDASLRTWMCNSKDAIKELTGNAKAKTKMAPQKICDAAAQDEVIAALKAI